MKIMIFYLYELLTILAPAALFLAVMPYMKKSRRHTAGIKIILPMLVFALYLFAVFHLTGAGTLYDIKMYHFQIRPQQINLLPFSRSIDIVGYIENILLFVPLGILLPLLGNTRHSFLYTLGGGLGCSLLIELSQLLNNRSTDVDDLIMNTLGSVLGFAAYKIAAHIFPAKNADSIYRYSTLFFYIIVLYLGRFLLFHEFGLASLLYFNK